jgi:hypothetical protein
MDKLNRYREIIKQVLELYASWSKRKPDSDVVNELVIDAEQDHYELLNVGWENECRVHFVVLHLDIINGKVWIQHDATNRPVADALLEAGVQREDIVLGFHPPEVRQYTDFAAA